MGKKIIVKGADFSANGFVGSMAIWQQTTTNIEELFYATSSQPVIGCGLFLNEALNKPINAIKIPVYGNSVVGGSFSIFKATKNEPLSSEFISLKDFTITSEDSANGYKIIVLDNPVTITNANETLMIGKLNNTGNNALPVPYVVEGENNHWYEARNTQNYIYEQTGQAKYLISYGLI